MKAVVENMEKNQLKGNSYSDNYFSGNATSLKPNAEDKSTKNTSRIIEAVMIVCLVAVLTFVAIRIISTIP